MFIRTKQGDIIPWNKDDFVSQKEYMTMMWYAKYGISHNFHSEDAVKKSKQRLKVNPSSDGMTPEHPQITHLKSLLD